MATRCTRKVGWRRLASRSCRGTAVVELAVLLPLLVLLFMITIDFARLLATEIGGFVPPPDYGD